MGTISCQKLKNLNNSFKKCMDRERELTKFGTTYSKTPRCCYYNQLLFLCDIFRNRVSNIDFSSPSSPFSKIYPCGITNEQCGFRRQSSNASRKFKEPQSIKNNMQIKREMLEMWMLLKVYWFNLSRTGKVWSSKNKMTQMICFAEF